MLEMKIRILSTFCEGSHTYYLSFDHNPDGITVRVLRCIEKISLQAWTCI